MAQASVTRETGEAARDAALSAPGVAGMHAGRVGEVALLLPGTRIEGLRAVQKDGASGFEVHLVYDVSVYDVSAGREIQTVAADVQNGVTRATGADFVDVVFADAVATKPHTP